MVKLITIFFLFISAVHAYGLCTKNRISNLYYGPHKTKYKVKLPLFKDTPLLKLKKSNGWYKVRDFTREEGWIEESELTDGHLCAIIKVNKAKLYRNIPGKNEEPQPVISYYSYTFKVIKTTKDNKWTQITNDTGKKFWVRRKHIWIH